MRFLCFAVALLLSSCARTHSSPVAATPPKSTADFLDLRPGIRLRVENAYWSEGSSRRGLSGYLGTEVATFRAQDSGNLKFVETASKTLPTRPAAQPPAIQLLPASHQNGRVYRLYYAVKFSRSTGTGAPVLLGARSRAELEQLAARLKDAPDQVCTARSPRCTVFPENCTVSAEMEITVNGEAKAVIWGSNLAAVAAGHPQAAIEREGLQLSGNQATATLLPGDRISW